MDEPLRLWLGDTGDWRGGGPDDEYTEYVVAYVRDAVELLMGSSYDGATIPRVLRRVGDVYLFSSFPAAFLFLNGT